MATLMGSKCAQGEFGEFHGNVLPDDGQADCCSHIGLRVLAANSTLLYRHLATTCVSKEDRAMEIGCSYGHCTALLKCVALGIDHAPEKVEDARRAYPWCEFSCGDVFSEELSWLDRGATVLLLDIGGGKNYKPVMKALAICIPLMPALRLAIVKSIEVCQFLLRFGDAAHTVARDLTVAKDDDAEIAEEVAIDIRRRGGELPVSLIYTHLGCGPKLRYLVGKDRILAFLKKRTPLLEVVEVDAGPPELRVRVRAAPGAMPPPAPSDLSPLRSQLVKQMHRQFRNEQEKYLLAAYCRTDRKLFRKFVAVAADPELHRQAGDHSLDNRSPEPWSDAWQSSVALRHFHAFVASSPEFAVVGETLGEVPTIDECRNLRVVRTAEALEPLAADENTRSEITDGQRILLRVMGCDWCTKEGGVQEVQDVTVQRSWLIVGGRVVEPVQDNVPPTAETCQAVP